MGKFFPEYLNKGSKGPAVAFLQALLLDRSLNPNIIIDGDYGEETAKGVSELQKELGVEEDGNFGPMTRSALYAQGGIDVDAIEAASFQGEIAYVGP